MRKLLILFFLATGLQIPFQSEGQGISLELQDTPLENVFATIQRQSPYRFVYASEDLVATKKINVVVKNVTINTLLAAIFKDQPVVYDLKGQVIVVSKKNMPPSVLPAKNTTLTGKVIDEEGNGLPAVTIALKTNTIVTATDDKGNFLIKDIEPPAVLVVSSIGYESRQVVFEGQERLIIQLSRAVNSLDETIIKGYYTTTRRLNTGNVSKVSAAVINQQPVTNPLAALQGRVPGLFITQGNGVPGANFTVQIRGRNSIQSGTSPLYIIDGVPFLSDADRLAQRSGLNANSPFNSINPADIESIEILKDADATAIYGSRGANGVILITTKKGKSGKSTLELNMYTGGEQITRSMQYMNTQQFLQMRREAFRNDGATPGIYNAADLLLWDTTRYTNWQKLLTGGTAHIFNSQLRFSGGNEKTRFTVGAGYLRESTVFPGSNNDQRSSVQWSLQHHSTDIRFKLLFSGSYVVDNSSLISQDLTQFINLPPNGPALYDQNGKLNWQENGQSFTFTNPIAELLKTYQGITGRLTGNTILSYQLLPNLNIKTSLGYNDVAFEEKLLSPLAAQNPDDFPYATASFGNKHFTNWIIEPQLEYKMQLGKKGRLEVLGGASLQTSTTKSTITDAGGYSNDALLESIAAAKNVTSRNSFSQYKYDALYGRIGYQYNNKYLLNLTARRDGSSRFGNGRQFANFGAVGAGWIFSDEHFFHGVTKWFNFGKLRGSYGLTGNDQIGDYQYLDTWSSTQYPYAATPSLYPSRLYNSDFSWERNKKLEMAMELGFFKNRIQLDVSWYRNRGDNQLINYTLSAQTGFTTLTRNFPGVVQNSGWEAVLSATIIQTSALVWKSSVNISIPKNQLLAFPGLESSSYAHTYAIGHPLNALIGYHFLGLDKQKGVYQVEDINKDGLFDQQDYIVAGSTNPQYYGGWSNILQWKGFELDFLWQFTKQLGRHPLYSSFFPLGNGNNQPIIGLDRWQQPGDNNPYQQYSQTFSNPAYAAAYLTANSDAVLTNASFVRLKNIYLSYQLPGSNLKKAGIASCRFFLQAQNLVTITKYPGSDPENQTLYQLPPLKVITGGVSFSF